MLDETQSVKIALDPYNMSPLFFDDLILLILGAHCVKRLSKSTYAQYAKQLFIMTLYKIHSTLITL